MYKSTRDSRIVVLVLVYTDRFLTDILDLPPTTKWDMKIGVANSISVQPDMFCKDFLQDHQIFDFQVDGAVGPGKRATGGEFHTFLEQLEPYSYPPGSCISMTTFISSLFILMTGEKYKMCLISSCGWFICILACSRNHLTWSLNIQSLQY